MVGQLRRLLGRQAGCTLTDARLLADFLERRDEAAFEVLVWRHGTMVLSLCQRILRDSHDAEDAFQATFLIFARKAASIGKAEAIASWLYKVAYRIALRLKARESAHGATEPADDLPAPPEADDGDWKDLRPVLDAEIARLPEKYRTPFVLCYLQGHTNEEAAAELGCPKGTILSRLARGRERLRSRLVRRGLALSGAALATALSQKAAAATVAAPLVASTVKAATAFAAGHAAAGLVSASVAALTEGVLRTMFLKKITLVAGVVLALAALGTGVGIMSQRAVADGTDRRAAAEPAAAPRGERERERPRERAANDENVLAGKVVAVAKDHKSITLETPPTERGAEPKKTTVTLGDKTTILYQGVGLNGATPTEGYVARIRFSDAGRDVAAQVIFSSPDVRRTSDDIAGRVVAIAKDGKGITIESRRAVRRGEEAPRDQIRFDDKTVLAFSNVGRGEAKLAEGQLAYVLLVDGSKDLAGVVQIRANAGGERGGDRREEKRPDVMGKVVAVGKDSVTLEQPSQNRGEEPTKVEIKLPDKATVVFQNVGLDGAKVSEGQHAVIWLEDGSKDTAARAGFRGVLRDRWTMVSGVVTAVSKDGSTVTLEQPARARGEEPKRVEVKVTVNTRISFNGIGPDEAKITEGQIAQARLLDGSADTAAQIFLTKRSADGRR